MSQKRDKSLEELRVVLMDDHAMLRAGVRHEIGELCQVVGEGHGATSSVATILETKPDVVLLGVHLPGGGGVEVVKQVAMKTSDVKLLALLVSDAAEDVIGVIQAGARGYVTRSISSEELVEGIQRVTSEDAVFSPRLVGSVLDAFFGAIDISSTDEELDRLSSRERGMLRLIVHGYSYREVARELFISIKTVETHVSSVLRKLQLSNRHRPTKWATDRHLV